MEQKPNILTNNKQTTTVAIGGLLLVLFVVTLTITFGFRIASYLTLVPITVGGVALFLKTKDALPKFVGITFVWHRSLLVAACTSFLAAFSRLFA